MAMLEAVPAVRRIETDRADLFAIDLVGHVSAADAENLFGLLEACYAVHPRIDVLVRMVDHDGVDWGEIDQTTFREGKQQAREHVRRCAAVGEPDWTGGLSGLFSSPEPVELRHFSSDDEAAAWAWLGAKPAE